MLPSFARPVSWRLGHLPDLDDVLPLLALETAEFTAVLGQPVVLEREVTQTAEATDTDVWDVSIDASAPSARLEADLEARRLHLTLPGPDAFADGVNLLHSLAHGASTSVSDTEAATYAEAFDRIHAEVANIYPSFELRDLDWDRITERYAHVRELHGSEFWEQVARWVAELGDAHTALVPAGPRAHPPYLAEMRADGAVLRRVPRDSAAWRAGVRPGHVLVVDDPERWLRTVGASPQHHALVAGRRFLAMTGPSRHFTAVAPDGAGRVWTETAGARPSVVARGNAITISAFTPDVPDRVRDALAHASPSEELAIDLRGNAGGSLVAAAQARRLFVHDAEPFGSVAFTTGRGTLAAPVALATTPAPDAWQGPVHVLIDAMTYSAAEDFLHALVGLPHVRVSGGPSGGGSGRPHTRLVKDGVRLSVSTAITCTRDGRPIEYHGIGPTGR